jgi:enoyl-CoA hydratase/carnithine racemase
VPGDGIHVIYEELLGVNRARYFALTQQRLSARDAERLGLVNEVVAKESDTFWGRQRSPGESRVRCGR